MKTALQIEITFDQILSLVKQLSKQQQKQLAEELEKDIIDARLTQLLEGFASEELDLEAVNKEVEQVRQEIYDKQKR